MPDEEWLDNEAAAALAGVKLCTWRSYVARGYAPPPDDPDLDRIRCHRRPRWRASTLAGWKRPGQGARTELAGQRAALVAARRAEYAEVTAPTEQLQAWLAVNHRALLEAADALVDLRDALVAAAGDDEQVAAAIDRAGSAMTRQPSAGLASTVSYALFMAHKTGGALAAQLARFEPLRAGYMAVTEGRA